MNMKDNIFYKPKKEIKCQFRTGKWITERNRKFYLMIFVCPGIDVFSKINLFRAQNKKPQVL